MRFHLDENTDHAIARALRQRGIDVTTSTEAELIGADDVRQLEYAMRTGRVIFTQDADFLRHHVYVTARFCPLHSLRATSLRPSVLGN